MYSQLCNESDSRYPVVLLLPVRGVWSKTPTPPRQWGSKSEMAPKEQENKHQPWAQRTEFVTIFSPYKFKAKDNRSGRNSHLDLSFQSKGLFVIAHNLLAVISLLITAPFNGIRCSGGRVGSKNNGKLALWEVQVSQKSRRRIMSSNRSFIFKIQLTALPTSWHKRSLFGSNIF